MRNEKNFTFFSVFSTFAIVLLIFGVSKQCIIFFFSIFCLRNIYLKHFTILITMKITIFITVFARLFVMRPQSTNKWMLMHVLVMFFVCYFLSLFFFFFFFFSLFSLFVVLLKIKTLCCDEFRYCWKLLFLSAPKHGRKRHVDSNSQRRRHISFAPPRKELYVDAF